MEFRKPVQILISREDIYKKWKKETSILKDQGLAKNIVASYMMEKFLSNLDKNREETLKDISSRIK